MTCNTCWGSGIGYGLLNNRVVETDCSDCKGTGYEQPEAS